MMADPLPTPSIVVLTRSFELLGRLAARDPQLVPRLEQAVDRSWPESASDVMNAAALVGPPVSRILVELLERRSAPALGSQLYSLLPERTVAMADVAEAVTRLHLQDVWRTDAVEARMLAVTEALDKAKSHHEQGLSTQARNRYGEALRLLTPLADQKPELFGAVLRAVDSRMVRLPLSGAPDDMQHVEGRALAARFSDMPAASGLAQISARFVRELLLMRKLDQALGHCEAACRLFCTLSILDPNHFRADHALLLNVLSRCQSQMGHTSEALNSAHSYLELCSAQNGGSSVYDVHGIVALHNLSLRLAALGREREACATATDAVLRIRLVSGTDDPPSPERAAVHANVGVRLTVKGDWADAEHHLKRAIAEYRALAGQRPDAHEPDLAVVLADTATLYIRLEARSQALNAAKEAVDILDRLGAEYPLRFGEDLGRALIQHAAALALTGEDKDALTAARRAVECFERLGSAGASPARAGLAAALRTMAAMLDRNGEVVTAAAAADRAVNICRELANRVGAAHALGLAQSLVTRASLRGIFDPTWNPDHDLREAIALLRSERKDGQREVRPELVHAMVLRAQVCRTCGQAKKARRLAGYAAALVASLTKCNTKAFPDRQAAVSGLQAALAFDVGDLSVTKEFAGRALDLRGAVGMDYPAAVADDVASIHELLTLAALRTDDLQEAQKAAECAFDHRQKRMEQVPTAQRECALARSGMLLAETYRRTGLLANALVLAQDAVDRLRTVSRDNLVYRKDLAAGLLTQSRVQHAGGRFYDALMLAGEAALMGAGAVRRSVQGNGPSQCGSRD